MLIIGAMYFVLGLWCLFRPVLAASGVGFSLDDPRAQSEFMTVYGGLQIGLGLAMMICARNPNWYEGALMFCLIFSSILVVARLYSLMFAGTETMTLILTGLEIVIALVLAYLWYRVKRAA